MTLVAGRPAQVSGGTWKPAPGRGRVMRYGTAVALTGIGLAVTASLLPVTNTITYSPLLGAVAISVWYGGLGAGLVATALGWAVALYGLSEPYFSFDTDRDGAVRWAASLVVALAITWIAWAVRRGRERAAVAAGEAERTLGRVEHLHAIASALSVAATPEDVAHALVEGTRLAAGASGAAMTVIENGTMRIVGPVGAANDAVIATAGMPLSARAAITTAAREGRLCWAGSRDQIERDFPDAALATTSTQSILAVPLHARGAVVGALGLAFDEPGKAGAENRSLLRLVAEMGGSALERASLYAEDRESRAKLEQILTVAPQFSSGTTEEVVKDVCRGARATFGVDVAQIWTVDDESFRILHREPPHPSVPPGTVVRAPDFPGWSAVLDELRPMFVPDLQQSLHGTALSQARATGIRSALRIPVVIGRRAERVLVLDWERVVPEPDAGWVALARRFADQAGLAIEQAERRRAQGEAGRRAQETRRLLDVTAALAAAGTVEDVGAAILEQSAHSLGAVAGVVTRRLEHEAELEIVCAEGFDVRVSERWRRFPLAADLPLADAVRDNRTIVLSSMAERDARYPALAGEPVSERHRSWLSVPLSLGDRAIGGIALAFPDERVFDATDLDFVASLARQAGQAFERARLLDAEHDARARAERIAASLAQVHALGTVLSRAVSAGAVAEAVGNQIVGVLDARSAKVYVVEADGAGLQLLGGFDGDIRDDGPRRLRLDAREPVAEAMRGGSPVWVERTDDWSRFPDADRAYRDAGLTLAAVPMVVDEGPIGVLCVTFDRLRALDAEERSFVETIGRQAAQPLDRVRLLEAERGSRRLAEQATDRTRRLQRVTERLAAAATHAEVGDVIVGEGMAALAGDAAVVHLLREDGGLELLAAAGYGADVVDGLRRIDASDFTPLSDVVRTGELLVLESPDEIETRYPAFSKRATASGDRASLCAPLIVGGRVLGALYVGWREPRGFDEDERRLAFTLARQCAQTLERARLYEAETAAADRVRRLQEVTAALSQAPTPEAVGTTCLEQATAAIGARAGIVAVMTPDAGVLETVGSLGYEAAIWQNVLLEPDSPAAEAVRSGEPVWALALEDAERYADAAAARAAGDIAWAAVPLAGRGGVVGVLVLGFAEVVDLSSEDRDWLVALAGQCAQALDRSRLYDDERATRRRSERLQSLTAALSGALTADEVARSFLEQAAGALEADGSALALADERSELLRPLAWRGFEEQRVQARPPISVDERHPIADAFRRRRSLVFGSREELAVAYPHLADRVREQGVYAAVVSPLVAGGRALGVVVFTWNSEHRLGADEHAFIAAVSSQCAQAFDRARRYESERTIAETLQRSVLPDRLPDVESVELAARYLPGSSGVDVGGDWFDVVELQHGRIGLVVGDVVGKGVQAAATMGQLRNALRAFAFEQLKPSSAVTKLNRLVETLDNAPFATLAYLTLDPRTRICRYTLAGHPSPIVKTPAGTTTFLRGGRSLPLGVGLDVDYALETVELEPGTTLLLYTDGLVERRDRSLQEGLEELQTIVEAAPFDPAALVDYVLSRLLDDVRGDDVAVLAVRLAPHLLEDVRLVLPSQPEALNTVRDALRSWLARAGASEPEAEDIILAVWEACANAVEHAQSPATADFVLEATKVDDRVRVLVRDAGGWKSRVERDGRGLGLELMRGLMDSVEVAPGAGGTVVRMERRVGAREERS